MALVVTSVCPDNLGHFRLNVEVALKFGPASSHHLLVLHDESLSRSQIDEAARKYFGTVSYLKHDRWEKLQKVPHRENMVWQTAARHVEAEMSHRYDCWLWWEQDACPLKEDWVGDIFRKHKKLGAMFSGYVYQTTHLPVPYMDRCGVWPSEISKALPHSGALYAQGAPFDRLAGADVMKSVAHNDLIVVDQDADFRFSEIKVSFPKACLLRGCDGTQQEVFLGRRDIGELDSKVRKYRYDSFLEQTDWEAGMFAFPYAEKTCYFNPAIIEYDGDLWLFTRRFRYDIPKVHGVSFWDKHSDLAIFKIRRRTMTVEPNPIVPKAPCRWDQENWEDPRAMVVGDDVYVSFATWVRDRAWTIRQSLVKLSEGWSSFEVVAETNYGGNANKPESGNRHEKNWMWFHQDGWHCVYSPSPHLTFKANRHSVERQWKAQTKMVWDYGEIRGGTAPLRLNDKEYVVFHHSSERWRGNKRRYFMGAYTFSVEAPFEPLRMTVEPLLIGSEQDPRVFEGPLVIFPGGAVKQGEDYLVVFGVNDENCGWLKVPEKDLQRLLIPCKDVLK